MPARQALDVLAPSPGGAQLHRWLLARAEEAYERRRAEYESIKTASQLHCYQQKRRRFFLKQVGQLPRRTPLNARTVGRLRGPGFRVEKVIFASQPQLLVTGNLYLPTSRGPHPAVLVPCGHNDEGKAAVPHQRLCMLLATHGLAAFCYDPIGQGERYQFLTDQGTRRYWPTLEHSLLGMGCVLLGTNTARYRIHDGRRALDYLQSRADIDGSRLGCTGYSGGGTLTSYLMALDRRVVCAAPCCYVSSLERTIAELGPQDAEQCLHAQIAFGMEHGDYLLMRAPAPTLICAASRDFFPIDGVWQVFREAKRMYSRLGFSERVELAEDDCEHDYSSALRVAATRWMRRWLLGVDDAVTESEVPTFPEEELRCMPRGQVILESGTRTAFDLNTDQERHLSGRRRRLWASTPRQQLRQILRDGIGLPPLSRIPVASSVRMGSVRRKGYRIDKLLIRTQNGLRLPALVFVPTRARGDACLYVHGDGKSVDARGPIARLARAGHLVLAPDVSGCGEAGSRAKGIYHGDVVLAYLLDLSLLGMRTVDILSAARFLAHYRLRGTARPVRLIGIGQAGPPALHAVALEPKLFASAVIRGSLCSWAQLVRTPAASLDFLAQTVHGALRHYDLPDLLELAPAGKITVEEPLDPGEELVRA